MTLREDLQTKVHELASEQWGDIPNGFTVPGGEALTFGNTGTRIDATVLYADIQGSTKMVDSLRDTQSAEYYKAFLHCAAKIIKSNGGTIAAYDGDRVMAVFIGDEQCVEAIRSALQITEAVNSIINPKFLATYRDYHRPLRHTVGIDCGKLLVAKTGVRVDSDLVWVGPAANYASKLNSFDGLDGAYAVRATADVINRVGLGRFTKISDGSSIWQGPFTNLDRGAHYRTESSMAI